LLIGLILLALPSCAVYGGKQEYSKLPSPTAKLHGELLKASAYAAKGQFAPDDPQMNVWRATVARVEVANG
jgi:DNA gyrase inhibitor GyrI